MNNNLELIKVAIELIKSHDYRDKDGKPVMFLSYENIKKVVFELIACTL